MRSVEVSRLLESLEEVVVQVEAVVVVELGVGNIVARQRWLLVEFEIFTIDVTHSSEDDLGYDILSDCSTEARHRWFHGWE